MTTPARARRDARPVEQSALAPFAAVLVLVLVALAALVRLPTAIHKLDANAAEYAGKPPLQRSLHAAYGEHIDPRFLLAARRVVPPHDTYELITGSGVPHVSPSTLVAVVPFTGYWLMPRTELGPGDTRTPDFVLSYGGNLHALSYRYRRVYRVAKGLRIAEVAR